MVAEMAFRMGRSKCQRKLPTHNERPLSVRYRKAHISSAVKNDLRVEFTESGLSYLGFGVQPPTPTWGNMLRNAQDEMLRGNMWMAIFPGLFLAGAVIAFNLLGDSVRDFLDPKLKAGGG